ncbi:MAG: M6 family metalloprotease domain-containing protein [Bacteroidetes bacterium]|nr:M6 family metalloprotease domain-containing protein [Bacteroidota bacterium]
MRKIVSIIIVCIAFGGNVLAAPFNGQIQHFKQPDGSMVDVRLYGNEFYMRAEGLDGYTLVRDKVNGWICYATLSDDKMELRATSVVYKGIVGDVSSLRNDIGVSKHLDILPAAIKEIIKKNQTALEGTAHGSTHPTNSINKRVSGTPVNLVAGNIKGLCIVVDFSDEVGTVPMTEFNNFCNDLNYTNYGNNGSLRKFYKDISGGLVDYQNVVYGYFRAPLTFAQYDAMPYAQGAQQILGLALNWIDSQGFDFSTLSTNPDGSIQAINLMYTGTPPNWAQGMWFHKGNYIGFSADGVHSNDYNCSPAKDPLTLATVAHENGHMIGKWPDTYKYGNTSGPDGIGAFDLMCWYGDSYNPVPPNPLFRSNVGWGRVVDVTNYNGINKDTANSMTCYKYRNINDTNEFFLLENRMAVDRSTYIPDQGLTIWHIDRNGDNQSTHHEVWLEHADNNYNNEDNACFRNGFNAEYSYSTTPGSNFYNGDPSGLRVWDISNAMTNMTYRLGSGQAGPSLNLMYVNLSGDTNGNGFVEPGESANLNVNSLNFGQLSSSSASVTCTAIGPNAGLVTVNTPLAMLGTIAVGQTIPSAFNITISPGAALGTAIDLKFLLSDGTDSIYITRTIIVGVQLLMSNSSDNTCSALFYDANGETNYDNNTDFTKTIFPSSSNSVIKADFIEFDVEDEPSCGYDYLKIYDGPNTSSTLLGMYCGTNSPGQVTSSHASGALTFVFHSDEGYTTTGWKAIISCLTATGVQRNALSSFDVFPNPSTGTVNVRFDNTTNATLSVLDLMGHQLSVTTIESKGDTTIDLSDQPNGMYFLRLQVGNDVIVKKIALNN